jgi:hypothetical protein
MAEINVGNLLNLQKMADLLYNTKELYKSDLDLLNLSTFCRLTSFLRITPDFFLGGAQKGGTTSLYAALAQHPQIIPGKFKEVFYYGNSDNYKNGLGHYKQFFATAFHKKAKERNIGKRALVIDASTNTLESIEAPKRILKDNPNAKMIFILRNPAERAYSHYKMSYKLGRDLATFEQALELEEARIAEGKKQSVNYSGHNYAFQRLGYKSRSLYLNYLKHWYKEFPKENILVVSSESFFSNPQKVYDSICEFLCIETEVKVNFDKFNEGSGDKMDLKTRESLNNYFKPYNEELFTLLNTRYDW